MQFGISCVRSTARGCPATATGLRAAARLVFQRATRRNTSVSALFRTRCRLLVLSRLEAKLVSLVPPLAAALVTHGCDRERAVSLEDFAPMRFVRQLHPREFCLNLRARELLEFLLGRGRWLECKHA